MFQQGAFVVNISGRPWHSIGIDEAHEMCINKQCKTSIVKPTEDYINRVAKYITYRTKALQAFTKQLLPERNKKAIESTTIFTTNPNDNKSEQNIRSQMCALETNSLLETTEENRGLVNPFTSTQASAVQSNDLLNFRKIGEQEFLLRISCFILKEPSVKAPNGRRSLKTFNRQVRTKRVSQMEKDKHLILTTIKRKMQFSTKTGNPINKPGEQILEYPLSLCDTDGNPLKGQKSYFTNSLQTIGTKKLVHQLLCMSYHRNGNLSVA